MLEKYLSPAQAAGKLGISRQAVHKMIRTGRLRSERIGTRYFVPLAEVSRLTQKSVKVKPKKARTS